ncbi:MULTISPECIES: hypothetical protein [unclassified Lysobacter]|uniref:hypothetical protein n=1 Tax=unclassified Lysobacter TaxID=2635362 RepID=UPI000A6A6780|nr:MULTISPECIES: hypothetical protein [unclassified Lysobacter]
MNMKMICASLLLLAGLSASGVAAAQTCPGKLVAMKVIRQGYPDGPKLGELQLYWDAASGKNCARTMHSARTWGKSHWTQAMISTCTRSNFDPRYGTCASDSPFKFDSKVYKYQAGPLSLPGKGRCVMVQGGIDAVANRPGGVHAYSTGISGHCR